MNDLALYIIASLVLGLFAGWWVWNDPKWKTTSPAPTKVGGCTDEAAVTPRPTRTHGREEHAMR